MRTTIRSVLLGVIVLLALPGAALAQAGGCCEEPQTGWVLINSPTQGQVFNTNEFGTVSIYPSGYACLPPQAETQLVRLHLTSTRGPNNNPGPEAFPGWNAETMAWSTSFVEHLGDGAHSLTIQVFWEWWDNVNGLWRRCGPLVLNNASVVVTIQ